MASQERGRGVLGAWVVIAVGAVVLGTVGVSNQDAPTGSGIPFAGEEVDIVHIDGGGDSGDARISSYAPDALYGYDGIILLVAQPVYAVGLVLQGVSVDFALELHWPDGSPMVTVPIPAGTTFLGVRAAPLAGGPAIGEARVIPGVVDPLSVPDTAYWSLSEVRLGL